MAHVERPLVPITKDMGETSTVKGGNDLATTAEKLRQVRLATRRFLALAALESARDRTRGGADVADVADVDAALSEFVKHDWSALY